MKELGGPGDGGGPRRAADTDPCSAAARDDGAQGADYEEKIAPKL